MGGDVTEEITSEVDLFGSIMQQHVIEIYFHRKYAPLASYPTRNANQIYGKERK